MAVLPPIAVGSGVNVTLRARGHGIFMLNEITRKIGYESPVLLERGAEVGEVAGTPLYGYERTDVQWRTRVMAPASPLYMNPVNPEHTYFISWADSDKYTEIDVMLTKYINALLIEITNTVVVP